MMDLESTVFRARSAAMDGRGTFARFKEAQLAALYNIVAGSQKPIVAAIHSDSGRATSEIALELAAVARHVRNLCQQSQFSRLVKYETDAKTRGDCIKPVGVVLVISADFAPLDSFVSPMATAILHGNSVIATLPPRHPALAAILAPLLLTLDRSSIAAVPYSDDSVNFLVSHGADAIFATARSPALRDAIASQHGRVHLVPRRLGLNAVVISRGVSVKELPSIAKAVARGAFMGLGRGVGSVDYTLVHEELIEEFVVAVKAATIELYGTDATNSRDYGSMVDHAELDELLGLLRDEFAAGTGRIVHGGPSGGKGLLPPTIIEGISRSSKLMQASANKGPILPVLPFSSLEDALSVLLKQPGDYTYAFADRAAVTYFADDLPSTVYASQIPLDGIIGISAPTTSSDRFDSSFFQTTTSVVYAKIESTPSYPPFTTAGIAKLLPSERTMHITRVPHSVSFLRAFFPQGLLLLVGSGFVSMLGVTGVGLWKLWQAWKLSR